MYDCHSELVFEHIAHLNTVAVHKSEDLTASKEKGKEELEVIKHESQAILPCIKDICTAEGGRVGATSAPLPKSMLPKSTHLGKQMYPSGCTLGYICQSTLVLQAGPYQPGSMGFKPWVWSTSTDRGLSLRTT